VSATTDEATFDAAAERTLRALEIALNEIDDVEADLESGILTVEFRDGARFVINSHRAARQVWMAAGASAWHFDWDESTARWTASRSGEELWGCVSDQAGRKLGRPLHLVPR
jgi:CyaY protein